MKVRPMQQDEQAICQQLLKQSNAPQNIVQGFSSHQVFVLEKGSDIIGLCQASFACQTAPAAIHWICVASAWQGKGYGSYLLKQLLHQLGAFSGTDITAQLGEGNPPANALFGKFDFCRQSKESHTLFRSTPKQLTALTIAHELLAHRIREGDFVIDATAGLGRDTAYLCRLVGQRGKVLAMDIQQQAVDCTNTLLQQKGLDSIGIAVVANHANLADYAPPHSVDAIVFNFGWLPKGNHSLFTTPKTSLPALEAALRLLKPHGFLIASIYHGGANGTEEKDTLLPWFAGLDSRRYTVVQCSFANRQGKDPIVFLVQAN